MQTQKPSLSCSLTMLIDIMDSEVYLALETVFYFRESKRFPERTQNANAFLVHHRTSITLSPRTIFIQRQQSSQRRTQSLRQRRENRYCSVERTPQICGLPVWTQHCTYLAILTTQIIRKSLFDLTVHAKNLEEKDVTQAPFHHH